MAASLVVGVGDCRVSNDAESLLVTYALGSCIAVTVHDPVAAVGGLLHFMLPESSLDEAYASYVGGIFRTVRYGVGEAHGRAELMEFNFLSEQRAITWDAATGYYSIDYLRMPGAIARLAQQLLEIEATGDRARAETWFKRYDQMPATLKSALDKIKDVPVDVDPVFSFPDNVQ